MFYKLALAAIVALVARFVAKKIAVWRLHSQLGANPVLNDERGNLYGFYSALTFSDHKSKGSLHEFLRIRNSELANPTGETFLTTNLGGDDRIVTYDKQNLMAVLATQCTDFILENRQDASSFFRKDGESLKSSGKSRVLTRLPGPQFAQAQATNVASHEPHFQNLETNIRNYNHMPLEVTKLLSQFAFRLTMDVVFGDWSLGSNSRPADVEEAFNTALRYCSDRDLDDSRFKEISAASFDAAMSYLNGFIDNHVRRVLAYLEEQSTTLLNDQYVFLHDIARDTRDPTCLRNEALSILLAGHNSTTAILSWAIFELARNPNIWQQLRAQVCEIIGQGFDNVNAESLGRCHLLQAVIKETLRMYPPAALVTSVAVCNTTLPRGGGPDGNDPILVRKGQLVSCLIYAAQRSPDFYGKSCLEFDPLRWLSEAMRTPAWLYIPFGAGVGGCMGKQLALSQTGYVLARLCQQFENLEPAKANQQYPPRMSYESAMTNMDGVRVKIW